MTRIASKWAQKGISSLLTEAKLLPELAFNKINHREVYTRYSFKFII